jgi:hypothetical protein
LLRCGIGLVRLEQDLGVLDFANVCLAARKQPFKLFALRKGEPHPVLFGHGWPPGLSIRRSPGNAQTITSALT